MNNQGNRTKYYKKLIEEVLSEPDDVDEAPIKFRDNSIDWSKVDLEKIERNLPRNFKIIEEMTREKFKNITKEKSYDEEYLKQFENLPEGYRFTEKELDEITDKGFRPLRYQQIYKLDRNKGDYYRKISYVTDIDTEEYWKIKIDNSMLIGQEVKDDVLLKFLGKISEFEVDRRTFKRMIRRRYEK